MAKVTKFIKNNICGLIIGMIITLTISVYAASTLSSSYVYYDNSESGGSSTNVSGAIDELYKKTEVVEFKVGDYINMTPTKTLITIPMTLTGYTSNQTINPSELNLWRVLRINSDDTVDIISEYVSSTSVVMGYQTGYLNAIGTLNYIAKQYENKKYTVSSRYTGYNGQTEFLTDTSKFINPAPWTSNTTNNSNEVSGGGDVLYITDINLISSALGTLIAKSNSDKSTTTGYWIASRVYSYNSASKYCWQIRYVNINGNLALNGNSYYCWSAGWYSGGGYASLRPILTLKSGISNISGAGTSESPYVLN